MKTPGIASKKSPDSSGLFFTFFYGRVAAGAVYLFIKLAVP